MSQSGFDNCVLNGTALVRAWDRAWPKRVREIDGIACGIAVQVEASCQANGVFLRKLIPRRTVCFAFDSIRITRDRRLARLTKQIRVRTGSHKHDFRIRWPIPDHEEVGPDMTLPMSDISTAQFVYVKARLKHFGGGEPLDHNVEPRDVPSAFPGALSVLLELSGEGRAQHRLVVGVECCQQRRRTCRVRESTTRFGILHGRERRLGGQRDVEGNGVPPDDLLVVHRDGRGGVQAEFAQHFLGLFFESGFEACPNGGGFRHSFHGSE